MINNVFASEAEYERVEHARGCWQHLLEGLQAAPPGGVVGQHILEGLQAIPPGGAAGSTSRR